MTDEQKVYIRGVEGRGDEVIKMLTDLGADRNGFDWDGNDPKTLYFISYEGYGRLRRRRMGRAKPRNKILHGLRPKER
jgi:hypothetical protein